MANVNVRACKKVYGDDILRIFESFEELEWAGFRSATEEVNFFEDTKKNPHHTVWRWKNPDPELDQLIVEAVDSFKGRVEWQIRSRERMAKLGGTNWIIETVKERYFLEKYKDLDLDEIKRLIREEEPEIGILSNQDVPKLAEHIKRYVEENRQSN